MLGPYYFVYRYYDIAGRLLYVGCIDDVSKRIHEHQKPSSKSYWMELVNHYTTHRYLNRGLALNAESKAIRDEKPLFNRKRQKQEHGLSEYSNWKCCCVTCTKVMREYKQKQRSRKSV